MCSAVCVCRRVYLCTHTRTVCVSVCLHYCMCLLNCAYCRIFFILWQFLRLSKHANLLTDHTQHVCLIHVCVHCMCYVISYVWSILVICHEIVWLPDGHPSSGRMSLGLLEPLAQATSHTVVYVLSCLHARSSHVAAYMSMVASSLCLRSSLSPNGCWVLTPAVTAVSRYLPIGLTL